MNSIVCHKMDTGERDLEEGGALRHAGVCDCVNELQHDRIQRQNMTIHRDRLIA